MIDKIEALSKEISKMIHLGLGYNDSFDNRHIKPFKQWSKMAFKDSVLVLGLNPSSSDIDNHGVVNDCFIHYFPDYWGAKSKQDIIKIYAKKGYTYNKYFKKPYELFLPYGYKPIWTNKTYLNIKKDILSKEEFELLNSISDSEKYTIFSDLIFYKETTAKRIEKLINGNKELECKILDLFVLQIKFFNSKLVFINNAYASRLLSSFIINRLGLKQRIYTNIEFEGTIIVFSAILTGARAMDNYSHERLKFELSTLLTS